MNNIYNVNWFRLVNMLVLPAVKKPLVLAFINSAIAPIRTNYDSFLGFKVDAEYRLKHNGQVCYLQKVLNDKFDNALRRIVVRNIQPKQPLWVYYPEDNKPVFVYNEVEHPLLVYNPEDYYNEFDFEVLIPTALTPLINQISIQVNYYKIYSKNFQIKEL